MKINHINHTTGMMKKPSNAANRPKVMRSVSKDSNQKDTFIKNDLSNRKVDVYRSPISPGPISIDKETATETTVHVGRSAFARILDATTYGETKWEECGVDDNKRWLVVNGQRFEVEHSAEEKARRKNIAKNLLDFIIEAEDNIKEQNIAKDSGMTSPRGNIEALKNNADVMTLLAGVFKANTPEKILENLL